MYLTKEEEKILEGELGIWYAKAMRLLVSLGDVGGADRLVEVKRAHLSGVSYKTIGDPILEMLEDMANAGVKTKIFTTLNPAGMTIVDWKSFGFPENFAKKQLRIIDAFRKMGVKITLTCAPYFFENKPSRNELVAFAESSVVVYANSIIGARTNRHGNLDALAAAIIGKVPYMGLLLKENRKATELIKVRYKLVNEYDFSLLGLYIGEKLDSTSIPAFVFEKNKSFIEDHLRTLGASLASSGSIAMFHIIGYTPEASNVKEAFQNDSPVDIIDVDKDDVENYKATMEGTDKKPDLIAIGCPHASIKEIRYIFEKTRGKKLVDDLKFWIFTSRSVKLILEKEKMLEKLEERGIRIITDTCMVVSPLEDMGIKHILTNSGKAFTYIPKLSKNKITVQIKSLEEILSVAFK